LHRQADEGKEVKIGAFGLGGSDTVGRCLIGTGNDAQIAAEDDSAFGKLGS
jgi:hypothetical protein